MELYSNLKNKESKLKEKREMDAFWISSIIFLIILFKILPEDTPDFISISLFFVPIVLGMLFFFRIVYIQYKFSGYTSLILTLLISPVPILIWLIPKFLMGLYSPYVFVFVSMGFPFSLVAVIYYFLEYRPFLKGKKQLENF